MSKTEKPHPTLIPDAPDPARLHFGACGGSETGNRGGPVPSRNFNKEVSVVEAIDQIELPRHIVMRRGGESYLDQTLRALPHILSALVLRFGTIPEELTGKDYRFLTEMVLWSKRSRAIKRVEQRRRNREYQDPPNDAA